MLHLTVEDNGKGFDLEKSNKGVELYSIRSRVKDWEGNISINYEKGIGTSVEIEITIKS